MDKLISHLDKYSEPGLGDIGSCRRCCARLPPMFVKEYLANPPMIIFVFPVMIFCGLAAYYLFVATEQFNPKKIDQWLMWTILASICGTIDRHRLP